MINKIILGFIAFLLLTSCGAGKHLPTQTEQKDSIRIEVRKETKYIRDTVWMKIPAQSAENTTRDTSSHLETDYAESDARINPDGTLYHSLRNKEQEKPVPVDVPVTQKDSIVYSDAEGQHRLQGQAHIRDRRGRAGFDRLAEMANAELLDSPLGSGHIRPPQAAAGTCTKIYLTL